MIECIGGPQDGEIAPFCMDDFDVLLDPPPGGPLEGANARWGRYVLRSTPTGKKYVWVGEVDPE